MTRFMAGMLAAALMAVAAGAPASAYTFLDRAYGTPQVGLSARARAMGGAGSVLGNGVYSLVDNPAALTLDATRRVQLATDVARCSENRFVPLFDTFDSYVVETAIAVNDPNYGSATGGLTWTEIGPEGLVLAAGLLDRYDPRYDYFDERRSVTTDEIVANRYISTKGVLRAWTAGAAYPVWEEISVGVSVNAYRGTWHARDALVPTSGFTTGRVVEIERRLSGTSLTLGALGTIGERLRAGLSFETAPTLHDDYTQWEDGVIVSPAQSSGDLRLPWRLQGGGSYRPRNTLRTTFALDVVYMRWSDISDHLNPTVHLLNAWDVRFGLEHVYFDRLPGRIGFRYQRSPVMREADTATFTFGVGYRAAPFHVDVAGEVGKRESRQAPIWPRSEQGPAVGTGRDRVEDTMLRFTVGAEVGF